MRHEFPCTLQGTGLFASTSPIAPREDFMEVRFNLAPWRPGITTRTWHLPGNAIVIQQHFVEKTGQPFETHIMWFDAEQRPSRIARAAAYRWNTVNDAVLIEDGEIITLHGDPAHRWFSPGTEEHLNLDTSVSGFLMPDVSGPSLSDTNVPIEDRVRSYLDVNCAVCHQSGGPSRENFDARFGAPLKINGELVAGDLGIAGARLIVPGQPDKSILLQRLIRHDTFRMPPTALNDDPQPVVPLLWEWIEKMGQ